MRTMDDSLKDTGLNSHPAGSKKLDIEAIEDPALINTVAGRLANLNKITGRVPGKNPAVSDVEDDDPTLDDDDTDVEDDNTDDDDQAVSSDDDDDSTPEDDKKEKEKVGIPDAYVRAAIHNGWKQEDIDAFAKANPEVATKTFENLYNSTNKASREWAAIGRANQQQKQVVQTTEPVQKDKLEYGGLDIAALKKEFDLDPGIERMLESSNARDKKLTDAINNLVENKTVDQSTVQVDRATKGYDVAAEAAQEQQVNGFFATDSMKSYNGFYGELRIGEVWENLPLSQQRNRYAVYTTADQLMAGASMLGNQSIELPEALERAHLLVTEGMREEVIRSTIKKTSKKRADSLLFKPSDGKNKAGGSGGKPKTGNELESKVAGLIQKALAK